MRPCKILQLYSKYFLSSEFVRFRPQTKITHLVILCLYDAILVVFVLDLLLQGAVGVAADGGAGIKPGEKPVELVCSLFISLSYSFTFPGLDRN